MQPKPGLSPLFVWDLCRPFRGRALALLALIALDSALASLGVGMIVPITGVALLSEQKIPGLALFGWLEALPYRERVAWLAAITVSLFALKALVSLAHAYFGRDLAERMRCFWVERIGERYLFSPFAEFAAQRQGALVNDWFSEPAVGARFLLGYMAYVSAILLTAGLLAIALAVEWRTTVAFVAVGLLVAFVLNRSAYVRVTQLGGMKLKHNQALGAAITENVGQLREVRLLGVERLRLGEVTELASQLRRIFVRLAVSGEAPRVVGEFTVVCIFMATIVGLVLAGRDAREFLPLLAFFFVAFYRLVTAGMQVVAGRIRILADLRSVELMSRLSAAVRLDAGRAGTPIEKLLSDVRFENVSFAYGAGEPVLRSVTLTIAKGKLTFLVGPSGAGKSTVLDLLMRLHAPGSGRIVANGRGIEELELAQWRLRLGYVSQDAALFNGTIRMNVLLGRPDASAAQVEEALRLAGAQDFLDELPAGAETVVGHRGYALSGGQAKRIAIARMLVRQPDLLILDEATSAFEHAMERAIIGRVRARYPEMSVLQVSHRLDSARGADHIVALEEGKVVASGPWSELAAGGQAYLVGP
jgi:ABC-type multidrug transport system fused ATPase/permease subunit